MMSPLKMATTPLSEDKKNTISLVAPIKAKLQRHSQPDVRDLLVIPRCRINSVRTLTI